MKEFKNIKIFLVDDDIFSLNLYEQHVRKLGYNNVEIYPNGSATLSNLKENPDVIFLDYSMKGLDGVAVLKEVKKYNPSIYVVMLSVEGNSQVISDSLEFGAFEYIKKGEQETQKMELVLNRICQILNILNNENN